MGYEQPPEAHLRVFGRVVPGHGVARGDHRDPRFPDGTLARQWPHFVAAGVPLERLFRGTVNVDTSPRHVDVTAPWWTVPDLDWHPELPPETFSFVPCRACVGAGAFVDGLVYWPRPETKADHPQPPNVLELLLPWRNEVHVGAIVRLDLPSSQVTVTGPSPPDDEDEDPAADASGPRRP